MGGIQSDHCYDIIIDPSNNIYVVGCTHSFDNGNGDLCLIKYDSYGLQLWNRTWGGISYEKDGLIALDHSDNYIYLIGTTGSFEVGTIKTFLVKYDNLGHQKWNKTWIGNVWAECRGMSLDSIGNIYISGITQGELGDPDLYLVKYDSSGTLLWNTTWGGSEWDEPNAISLDSSDNIYISGISEGAVSSYFFLLKYNGLDLLEWNLTPGIEGNDHGLIVLDCEDNIFFTGNIPNNNQLTYFA